MAKRVCFLLGARSSEYQAVDKFLDSFRRFNLSSQADVAIAFESEKDRDELFLKLRSKTSARNIETSSNSREDGELYLFDSPKTQTSPQDEADDEEENFFFFMGEKPKKSNQPPKPNQSSVIKSADDEMQKALEETDAFFFFPNEEPNSQPRATSLDNSLTEDGDVHLIPIVLPKDFQALFNNAGTFRARILFSLNKLKNDYDYIIACEPGTAIVKNVDVFALCQKFFDQKILWGNEISGVNRNSEWIRTSCTKWFANTLDWHRVLSPLYLWLNQPFIYRTEDLDEFFEVTEILQNLTAIAWTDFHYYIYMYYLILYRGFRIRDIGIKSNIGVCESNSLSNVQGKVSDFRPMICKKSIQRLLDNDNLFIVTGA